MADTNLDHYVMSMEIDSVTGKPIPKVALSGAEGGSLSVQTNVAKLSDIVTLQNAAVIAGVGTPLPTSGMGVAVLAVSGTFVGTISFEGEGPDGKWYSISAAQRGTGAIATTGNAVGLYELNVRGLTAIRANITSYTSGSITVKGQAQPLAPSDHTVNANSTIQSSNAIVPTDIQSHLQTTIQTHNAVSVAASSYSSQSNYFDTDGFDKVAITVLNDAATGNNVDVSWSNDGTTEHGKELSVIANGSVKLRAGIVDTKARYCKIIINNSDTIAHTMSAWVYLKA